MYETLDNTLRIRIFKKNLLSLLERGESKIQVIVNKCLITHPENLSAERYLKRNVVDNCQN